MKKTFLIYLVLLLSTAAFAQRAGNPLSREQLLDKKYASGLFSSVDGIYFDMENDDIAISANTYINVLDWLQGRVAGLQVYTYRNSRIPFLRNSPAAIFVDEVRVDATFLNALPVNDIGMIKVIKAPFWGGLSSGGVLAIYTKNGDEEEETQ